jgi:ribosomal protein S18 acetylase RimI-like enzyme
MAVSDGADGGYPVVVRVDPHQWALLREVRLEALRQGPDAFGATYADESIEPLSFGLTARPRASGWWRSMSVRPVAMVEPVNDRAGERQLYAMWVSPSRRGSGVAERLTQAVIISARLAESTAVTLTVAESNAAARRLYARAGFQDTGERIARRQQSGAYSRHMSIRLT